jgi:hypothetical protein
MHQRTGQKSSFRSPDHIDIWASEEGAREWLGTDEFHNQNTSFPLQCKGQKNFGIGDDFEYMIYGDLGKGVADVGQTRRFGDASLDHFS